MNGEDNVADMLTKPLGGGEKRKRFIGMILHHLADDQAGYDVLYNIRNFLSVQVYAPIL